MDSGRETNACVRHEAPQQTGASEPPPAFLCTRCKTPLTGDASVLVCRGCSNRLFDKIFSTPALRSTN
jgi:hypothetical protein